ncbi:MAG: DUF805 domain-containing protein [Pseudomonadota bacterium]
MGIIRLFTSFNGRIGRGAYWLGLIVLIAASPFSISAILSSDPFGEAFAAVRDLGVTGLGWTLALFLPLAALNTKRLHDLGQTGLIAVLFYAPAALSAVTLFTGWTPSEFDQVVSYSTWLAGLFGAASVFFLFRLGFYPGTAGPNKYGPDPSG